MRKSNIAMIRKISKVRKKKMVADFDRKMAAAVLEGDMDKVLTIKFLRDRL